MKTSKPAPREEPFKASTQLDHHYTPGLITTEESRTQQQYLLESDINHMLTQYDRIVTPLPSNGREPIFGDFSDDSIGDFRKAMQTITGVNDLMRELPAKVRARFQNNPAEILDFVANPANKAEAIELGLIDAPPEPARTVPVPEPDKK